MNTGTAQNNPCLLMVECVYLVLSWLVIIFKKRPVTLPTVSYNVSSCPFGSQCHWTIWHIYIWVSFLSAPTLMVPLVFYFLLNNLNILGEMRRRCFTEGAFGSLLGLRLRLRLRLEWRRVTSQNVPVTWIDKLNVRSYINWLDKNVEMLKCWNVDLNWLDLTKCSFD